MIEYTPSHQLTDSSTLHILRRDPKDRQHLNHNLNYHIAHGPSRCDASIYLKPAEETFDAVEDVDKLVLGIACIFSRLGSVSKQVARQKDVGNRPKGACQSLQRLHLPVGMPVNKKILGHNRDEMSCYNTHQPNALTNSPGK
jgi:hypothetical protein